MGKTKPWPQDVNDFDVRAFADMVQETGAGYVVFTGSWGPQYFPSPIEAIERILSGRTCERDLIGEIADALGRRGMRLIGICFGINICADSRHLDTVEALAAHRVRLVHNPHANFLSLGRHAEEWTRGKLVYYMERVIACRAHILINNLAGTVRDSTGASYDFSGAR